MTDFRRKAVLLTMLVIGMLKIIESVADEKPTVDNDASSKGDVLITRLKPFAGWVGEWRGVVQLRRGSSAGAWTEKATVEWQSPETKPEIVLQMEPGRQLHSLRLSADPGLTVLSAILEDADGNQDQLTEEPRNLSGNASETGTENRENAWVFVSTGGDEKQKRVTVRLLSRIRATLLLEERVPGAASWKRISECGLTRAGERLAARGTGEKECIVTGGLGSIPVAFEGASYFVCCEGCRQIFDNDPMETIAAYRKRLQEESADKGNSDR